MNQDLPAPFGKYQLEQFLGGGMAHVYRATDTVLNRTVCVTILTEEGAADGETRARFLAEAKMTAGLVHDNAMEFLTGSDLRKLIDTGAVGDFTARLILLFELFTGTRAVELHEPVNLEHLEAAGVHA